MLKKFLFTAAFIFLTFPAYAAGDAVKPEKQKWSFGGSVTTNFFGTYDRAALQRGFQIYSSVCAACHSMKHLSYRNLESLGYSEAEVKAIAAEYTMMDGPNEEGDMEERPMKPSDTFAKPYPNKQAAMASNNGAMPPDLSLITKARMNGHDYLYGLLTGYTDAPEGEELGNGQYWNKYMPGHKIAMAPPLQDGQISYEDGSPETLDQYARDITQFLAWAAEPELEERRRMGIMVLLFLAVFAGVMYKVKKKVWSDLH